MPCFCCDTNEEIVMGLTSVANGVFVVRFVVPVELVLLPPLLEPVVVRADATDGEAVTVT